jgi:protein-disulfide isomerase
LRIALQLVGLLGFLGLGLAVSAWSGCRDSSASSTEEPAGAAATAVAQVKDIVLPGVDTSPMTPRERRAWTSLVTQLLAPCPAVPVTIAQCVQEKRACGGCMQAAKWIARAVRDGASADQIQHAYKDRFDPASVKALPIDDSPTKGPDDAPVTIVEFADFECPHCREAVGLIDAMMAAHPDKIRLVYKAFTLPFHVHGEPAARAAFAAGVQGKFWEMEHLLFERQQHLEDADLQRYAQMLKLDLARWKADMDSAATKERVLRDHNLGEEMKLKGTPTIYVNGRELDVEQDESLEERVAGELGLSGLEAPAAPSASGAPAASAPAGSPGPTRAKPQ